MTSILSIASFPAITKTDFWLVIALSLLVTLAIKACRGKFPDPGTVQNYATVCNTKGGIILILLSLWVTTLLLTVVFCVWVIIRGVDPQHPVIISLLGVLTGTAFGNVNGALFKTMTGEDPKPPSVVTSQTVSSVTTAAVDAPGGAK